MQKIVAARKDIDAAEGIRKFSKSSIKLKFDAESYYDFIDWDYTKISPPPLLSSISSDELLECAERGPLPIPPVPCHSQTVEGVVKDVTRVFTKVFGHDARHGMLVCAELSRNKKPKLEAKHSYT